MTTAGANAWGLHVAYQQPVGGDGVRVGVSLTGNGTGYPALPNYANAARATARGSSFVYELGFGVSQQRGPPDWATTLGFDLIFQPATAESRLDAARPVRSSQGRVYGSGQRIGVEEFWMLNWIGRFGFDQALGMVNLMAGAELRNVRYDKETLDLVANRVTRQTGGWTEFTPTWGIRLRLRVVDLYYTGYVRTIAPWYGRGGPSRERGVVNDGGVYSVAVLASGSSNERPDVWGHRVSVVVPIGR